MNEEWLYIMDYADCNIYKLNITDIEDDDIERIIGPYGFNIDECAYMYSDSELDSIKELTEEDKV